VGASLLRRDRGGGGWGVGGGKSELTPWKWALRVIFAARGTQMWCEKVKVPPFAFHTAATVKEWVPEKSKIGLQQPTTGGAHASSGGRQDTVAVPQGLRHTGPAKETMMKECQIGRRDHSTVIRELGKAT